MMVNDKDYGLLPASTLRVIKKYGVTPDEYDFMSQILWEMSDTMTWEGIEESIEMNSPNGQYDCTIGF